MKKWLAELLGIKEGESQAIPTETGTYPPVRPYFGPRTGRRKQAPSTPINHYYIPLSVMESTDRVFRRFAKRDSEGYVWWTGYLNSKGEAQVCSVLCPEVKTQFGRVHLDRKMTSAMHQRLIELDQILLVELHTHPPGAGGQNEVDADNAAVFYSGFISIVVPDFGRPRFYDLRDSFVYEYQGSGCWRTLKKAEIENRFLIEETLVEVKCR